MSHPHEDRAQLCLELQLLRSLRWCSWGLLGVSLMLLSFESASAAEGEGQEPLAVELENSANASVTSQGSKITFHLDARPADNRLEFRRLYNVVQLAYWEPPIDERALEPPRSSVKRPVAPAYEGPALIPAERHLGLRQDSLRWTLTLSDTMTFPCRVHLQVEGQPWLSSDRPVVSPGADQCIVLRAEQAEMNAANDKLQFEPLTHKYTVGYWVNPKDRAAWTFATNHAGMYDVFLLQGCGAGQGGSTIRVDFGEEHVDYQVVETGHFQNFRWKHAGTVQLPKSDAVVAELSCVELAKNAVMDLRQIRLVPVGPSRSIGQSLHDVANDSVPPVLKNLKPRGGQRVIQHAGVEGSKTYHTVYLPTNWNPKKKFPVLVEWAGNGPYKNAKGDVNTGRVEDGRLAYGLAGNDGYIQVCLPFVDSDGEYNVSQWWGTAPEYDPQPTLDYAQAALDQVCEKWGGDPDRLVLVGFSRGAIACNYLGLHDDEIAKRWAGFICFSHYDGLRSWPFPKSDTDSAIERLRRLGSRPQLIIGESHGRETNLDAVRDHLAGVEGTENITMIGSGFSNHDDDWTLRPSPARQFTREWLSQILKLAPRDESL